MKKIKLFALAVMAMLGTNAMADDNAAGKTFSDAFGLKYKIVTAYQAATTLSPAVPGTVTVIEYTNTLSTNALEIPATTNNSQSSVDIPDTYSYNVVGIEAYAATTPVFKGCKATKITIPASVESIGKGAFEGCEATEIAIKSGSQLTSIGDDAFKNATKLATFGSANALGLKTIGANAFQGTALTAFTFGVDLTSIGAEAFKGTKITTLDFSACTKFNHASSDVILRWFTDDNTTTDPDKNKYLTNTTLTTVILPTSVATSGNKHNIAANAFKGCTALTTIGATANAAIIPASVGSIGAGAFLQTNITKFDMSASAITAIGTWFSKTGDATTDPSKLQQIILKNDVAYTDFSGLTKISTLKKVGIVGAEYALPKTTSVATTSKTIVEGIFAGTALEQLDLSKIIGAITDLPALFWEGGASTSFGITSLTAITLNNQTVNLAANAFAGCTNLATLAVKDKDGNAKDLKAFKVINNAAFWQTKISSLTFGDKLTTLTGAFAAPATATEAQQKLALSNATSLTIDMSESTDYYGYKIADNTFKGLAALTSIKLPTTLVAIGVSAFEGTGITEIEIPAGLNASVPANTIGNNAFKDCKSLKTVTYLTEGTTEICYAIEGDDNVFKGCNLVTIYASSEYVTGKTAPVNTIYAKLAAKEIKTALDKKTSGYAMKGFYDKNNAYRIKTADVTTVYEAYLNDGDVVLSRMKKKGDYYEIPADFAVIVRTVEEKTVVPEKVTLAAGSVGSSLLGKYTDADTGNQLKSVQDDKTPKPEANYIYALTNKASEGFAFSFYSGATFNNGNIYVVNPKAPSAAGRMNIIFLDEDGNVEFETTAIQGVQNEAENDGEIFNLSGQKVNGAYKGIVIKNGKKMIQK